MPNPKDILVITTSGSEGLKIKKYIKPVSSHIVAGTNLFSDFFGGLTDVFGGRSQTYQKQLTSLYQEAIERIKEAAYELGANCIIGLSIDMDEISGKGKSMFMLTAIGTAVILERENIDKAATVTNERLENVSVERINNQKTKNEIVQKANEGSLVMNDETWDFITSNQVVEIFPFLLKQLSDGLVYDQGLIGPLAKTYRQIVAYVDGLPDEIKPELLYAHIKSIHSDAAAFRLSEIVKELNMFEYDRVKQFLLSDDFKIQKRGLLLASYDKPFYNSQDRDNLNELIQKIESTFPERGTRSSKKQMLSSKEKEVWTCECGKVNDIGSSCISCQQDIYGFRANEVKPLLVANTIRDKVNLLNDFIRE